MGQDRLGNCFAASLTFCPFPIYILSGPLACDAKPSNIFNRIAETAPVIVETGGLVCGALLPLAIFEKRFQDDLNHSTRLNYLCLPACK